MRLLPKGLLSERSTQIYLLVLVAAALYYPALRGTVNSIDDVGILTHFGSGRVGLLDILRPNQGYYYRPLIDLSYYLDYRLLGQKTALLHLENVLLHVANTVLLFLLASRLLPKASRALPLAAALLFACHPINTEPVNWIAGRTDPLAALFVLLSALALCRGLESGKARHTVLAGMLLCAGVLAKETALLFIPASFLLGMAWQRHNTPPFPDAVRLQRKLLFVIYGLLCLVLGGVLAYRVGSHSNSMQSLFSGNRLDLAGSALVCVKILGFYLKKMLFPWPLNFAIDSVAGWYLAPGLAALLLMLLAPRRNPYYPLFLTGVMFLLPAIAVGLFGVAWTVVAERYLYLPSAFFCLALAGVCHEGAARLRLQHLLLPLFLVCIGTAALSSLERTRIWQSNLALYQDSVAKSPDIGMLHNQLAVALIQEGRMPEARRELDRAESLNPSPLLKRLVRRNRLLIEIKPASPAEIRRIITQACPDLSKEDSELLAILRQADYRILRHQPKGAERDALMAEIIETSQVLYARTGDPLLLYNNGQLSLELGRRDQALSCFTRSYRLAPDSAFYKQPAGKLAARLGAAL